VEQQSIDYVPEPTPALFHASDSFVRGIMGPVGSGKSVACILEVFLKASQQRPSGPDNVRKSRWAVIRNTYPELKTTTIKTFLDWFGDIAVMRWDVPITASINVNLDDGTIMALEIMFIAMDRPKDIQKLKSLELTGAFLNEACELSKTALDMATSRVGRYPAKRDGGPSWHGIIMDTNPPDDDHWYYRLAEEDKPEIRMPDGTVLRYEFWRQPPALFLNESTGEYVPNPNAENIINLELGYQYYFQQLPGKTREWINVFVMGLYGTIHEGRPVYSEYNDQIHCSPDIIVPLRGLALLIGWDFGLTPSAIFAQFHPRGQLRVIDELVSKDMGINQFARDVVKPHIANEYAGMGIQSWGDPAGGQRAQADKTITCLNVLALQGLRTTPAPSNDWITRREGVVRFMTTMRDGEPGFLLSPKCRVLRKGFNGGYKYDRVQISGEDRFKDMPSKNSYSHPHDALQYLCLGVTSPKEAPAHAARKVQTANAAGWT
jgi:hypothetical protein